MTAVKLAEDRSGDVVVRLYESLGRRSTVTVTAGFPAAGVVVTDLLERELDAAGGAPVDPASGSVILLLRPFQIVTVRIRRVAALG